jgi:hypothetical protein
MQNRWEATSVAANDEREDYIAAPPAFLSHTGSPPHARRLFQYRPCAALPLLDAPRRTAMLAYIWKKISPPLKTGPR